MGARIAAAGRRQLPRHAAEERRVRRPAPAADDLPARPARAACGGPRLLRARPRPAHARRHRRVPGRLEAQPRGDPRLRRARHRWCAGAPRDRRARARRTRNGSSRSETGTPYLVLPFVDRMDYALAAADLMVCRAGANSVVEAAATGVPTIFVPLAHGNGEQAHNARPVVDAGGALMADEAAFTADYVADTVPAAGEGPRPAGRDGSRGVRTGARRRRRPAGPDRRRQCWSLRARPDEAPCPRRDPAPRSSSAGCTSSGSAAPACPGSPGSWHRRGVPVTGSDDNDPFRRPGPPRARHPVPPRLRRRAPRTTRHRGRDDGRPRRQPGDASRPSAAVCRCSRGRPASAAAWPDSWCSPSPAPTARPRRRRC